MTFPTQLYREYSKSSLGGGFNDFFMFTPKIGEDEPKFDEHIFPMGWFNHQLDVCFLLINAIPGMDFLRFLGGDYGFCLDSFHSFLIWVVVSNMSLCSPLLTFLLVDDDPI